MTLVAAVLLAHGNGWDETAFILTPVAIFGGLLAVANKRASGMSQGRPTTDAVDRSSDDADPAAAPTELPTADPDDRT